MIILRISEIVENLESIETVTPDYSLLGYRGMNYEEAETTVNKAVYEACDAIEKAVELLEESKEELQNSYGIETDLVKRINSFLKEDLGEGAISND